MAAHKVLIYTTPTCVYCKMAKAFFKQYNIPYEEKNVVEDIPAQEDMIKKSGQLGVPVIDVDGQIIVGFDQTTLSHMLGMK